MTSKRKTKAFVDHLLSSGHAAKLFTACHKRAAREAESNPGYNVEELCRLRYVEALTRDLSDFAAHEDVECIDTVAAAGLIINRFIKTTPQADRG